MDQNRRDFARQVAALGASAALANLSPEHLAEAQQRAAARGKEAGQEASKVKGKPKIQLGVGASLGGFRPFPPDNPWNQDISKSPVDRNSTRLIASIGLETPIHPDFGTVWRGAPNGLPYMVVPGDQPKVPMSFRYESDPGPYPFPPDFPIQGGPNADGDRHVIVIDRDNLILYEAFKCYPPKPGEKGGWKCGSGAIFDLKNYTDRPAGWTSADAAGMPIFPGLVRYDEVFELGAIQHALRFTIQKSSRSYVHPARHFASKHTDMSLPPMGMRVRLKADYDIGRFPRSVKVILQALKTYGMFVIDNGPNWFVSGAPDPRWDNDELRTIKRVKGKDFEVVRMGKIVTRL